MSDTQQDPVNSSATPDTATLSQGEAILSQTPEAETLTTSDSATASVESLQARIVELENRLKDQQLRAQAELQNLMRRTERDISQANKYALEKFSAELLAVIDNLERALAASNPDDEAVRALRDGVVLTHKLFGDALKKFKIESIEPVGEPFNPELHQAVSTQASNQVEPNTVLTVYQKGYLLNGRLLRPAIVVVASAG